MSWIDYPVGAERDYPPEQELLFGPASTVTIIGFPFALTVEGFPVWTRGAVASEPALNYDGLPCFLIDSRTRSGQSGSPVLIYHRGGVAATADGNGIALTLRDALPRRVFGAHERRVRSRFCLARGRLGRDSQWRRTRAPSEGWSHASPLI